MEDCKNQTMKGPKCENCKYKEIWAKRNKRIGYKNVRQSESKTKSSNKNVLKKKLESVKAKAHRIWSNNITNAQVDINGGIKCSTCEKVALKALFGIHGGHLYNKSEFWYLGMHPHNGGCQCYNCNVNYGGRPLELRTYLVKAHGETAINELDALADKLRILQKRGFISKYTLVQHIEFYNAEIARMKKDFHNVEGIIDNINAYIINSELQKLLV